MNKELLNALTNEDMNEVVKNMIHSQRHFGYGSTEYKFENGEGFQDAIDYEQLTIKTDVWMKNTLEQDDFSKNINRMMYLLESENKINMHFDYEFVEYFQKELGFEFENVVGGYTYNNADYCMLDRDIHYTTFEYEGESYVIFSVHYGADARAGFGYNACFKIEEDYFFLSMELSCYDSVTDEDYSIWELEDIATFNKEENEWYHKETGNLIHVHSSANGW